MVAGVSIARFHLPFEPERPAKAIRKAYRSCAQFTQSTASFDRMAPTEFERISGNMMPEHIENKELAAVKLQASLSQAIASRVGAAPHRHTSPREEQGEGRQHCARVRGRRSRAWWLQAEIDPEASLSPSFAG